LAFRTSQTIGIFDPARAVEAVRSGRCLGSEERPPSRLHTAHNTYQVSLNGSVIGSSGVLAAASNVDDGHWHAFDT
jgi:hypothetical protein